MKHSILVLEDDEAILDAFTIALEENGYSVIPLGKDGDALYTSVQTESPSLIIIDLLLSGTDGKKIVKRLKSTPAVSSVPILMMSAHSEGAAAARDVGADGFLEKPFDLEVMLKTVATLIRKAKS